MPCNIYIHIYIINESELNIYIYAWSNAVLYQSLSGTILQGYHFKGYYHVGFLTGNPK